MQSTVEKKLVPPQLSGQALPEAPLDSKGHYLLSTNHQLVESRDLGSASMALYRAVRGQVLAEIDMWLERAPTLINGHDTDQAFHDTDQALIVWSLESSNTKAFYHLLSKGAKVDVTHRGYSLAEWLALHCCWPVAEKISALQALAERGMVLNPALLAAVKGDSKALSPETLSVSHRSHHGVEYYASANGQLEFLRQLKIDDPFSFSNLGGLILIAVENDQLATTKYLLEEAKEDEITARDVEGNTALMLAAKKGHLGMAKWLVDEKKADVGEKNRLGQTALLLAAKAGNFEMVKWLLSAGASITEQDNEGYTALLYATQSGNLPMVHWLLQEGGANITDKSIDGQTVLRVAADHLGNFQLLEQLVTQYGADPGDDYMGIDFYLGGSGAGWSEKAARLQDLFYKYHHAVCDILVETESTSNRLLIKELWKIIADYGDIGIGAIEKNLLQQLKTYSEEPADSSDESHNLARELLTIIAC